MSKIYDKTAANFKATTVDAKIIDAQKILVRPKGGAIDERVNILDAFGDLDVNLIGEPKDFDTNSTTFTGETEGVSIQLDKVDFLPSGVYIKEVSLPYIQGINSSARFCHLLFYNGGEQIGKITSVDTQTRQTGNNSLLTSTWHYKNVLIPDYQFVRIVLSDSTTGDITGTNGTNCSIFRVNVCRNQSNQNINPTNLSKIYNSNGTTQAYLGWVQVKYAEHILSNLVTKDEIESFVTNEELNGYVTDDELNNYVTNEEFNELVKNTQLYYYDTWTNVKNQDSLSPASIKAFQYSKSDFVASRFDRIEFPFMAAGNTGYLCVQFFDSNSQVIENATYFSNNKFAQVGASDRLRRLTTFTFDEIYPPDDYAFVRFSFVAEKVAPISISNGMSIKAMYINRSGASWGSYTYLYNDSAARQNLTIYITVLSRKGAKNTGITYREYDWTPDFFNGVTVTMSAGGKAFVAPTNGWLISNAHKTTTAGNTITINSIEFGYSSSTAQAPVQMLLRKGDVVTSSHSYTVDFYPCKSEQHDYIPVNEHTPYDIWKGAVIYDANGEVSVSDLYIPDASAWKTEVGNAVTGSITRIEDEQAFDSSGNVLFNIQSQYIENGKGLLVQSTITTWSDSLANLRIGEQMFGYSSITNWTVDMPLLWKGDTMFYNCKSLTSFSGSLQSLTSGWNMFCGCSTLTDVNITSLSSLNDGTAMFGGCALSYQSLLNILNALPTVTTERYIDITIADSAVEDLITDERFADAIEIPGWGNSPYTFNHKGWQIALTSQSGVIIGNNYSEYAMVEGSQYIPDASTWNDAFASSGIVVTSVHDGYAWNDNLS